MSRDCDQIGGFLEGLEIVEPGVVQIDEWHPDAEPRPVLPPEGLTNPLWAAMGRKP